MPINIQTTFIPSLSPSISLSLSPSLSSSLSSSLYAHTVADTVVVTSKHNDDKQYIWESSASEFTIVEDPRGPTLKRGTTVSLFLKEEAQEFLEPQTLRSLVEKYSQFINFPIYIWESKVRKGEKEVWRWEIENVW